MTDQKERKSRTTISIYKGKGGPTEFSRYTGVRLLDLGMTLYKSVLDNRLR